MSKKLVILGGNEMACPAIQRMRESGYKVTVIDGDPQAAAQNVADHFVNFDFTKTLELHNLISRINFDGIMPLNDFAVKSAAYISRVRNLPGWNQYAERCLTSKIEMKKSWDSFGLKTAKWTSSTVNNLLKRSFDNWLGWPCIIKPSFSGGGSRGVFLAENQDHLIHNLSLVSKSYLDNEVLIEEYIKGTEHTLEVVIFNGEPFLLSISDKYNYPGSSTVVQKLNFPGPIGNSYRSRLKQLVYSACKAMNLTYGAAHFEVLIRENQCYLLEVGGRPGGGLNFHPICLFSTGYDYPNILASILTGTKPEFYQHTSEYLAWYYFPEGNGVLKSVNGIDKVQSESSLIDLKLYEIVGEKRFKIINDLNRPGYVLVKSDTIQKANHNASRLMELIEFVIDE